MVTAESKSWIPNIDGCPGKRGW